MKVSCGELLAAAGRVIGIIAKLAVTCVATSTLAAPVTLIGNGVATATSADLGVANPFRPGDSITFSLTFDSNAPDLALSAAAGRYQISGIQGALVVDGVAKHFAMSAGSVIDIQVFPGFMDYEWYVRGTIEFDDPLLGPADLGVSFRGPEYAAIGSQFGDALVLPPLAPQLADQWFVRLSRIGVPSVTGLNTMSLNVVPEPGTLPLIGAGMLAVVAAARRKRRSLVAGALRFRA